MERLRLANKMTAEREPWPPSRIPPLAARDNGHLLDIEQAA
jgi:hypothetical protein